MAAISNWLWGTSQLDEAVVCCEGARKARRGEAELTWCIDKATSELIPSGTEDVALNLEICDQIRSKSVSARDAMRALKRRLNHKNPNVQLLALGLTDTCVKNGGDLFLVEVASREFMDNLVSILKMPALNHQVKGDILRCVQNWSLALEGKPSLSYVGQVYKNLKADGFDFPPKDLALANAAMVDTAVAPEWIDSDVCLRCREPFTFTNRKHHCRNCGQVFDQQCSAKSVPLPHFGIQQPVRVCDGCHAKLHQKAEKSDRVHRHTASMYSSRHRNARDLQDADLQRAIQLSLAEVGAAGSRRPGYVPAQPSPSAAAWSEPPLVDRSTHPSHAPEEEDDPDLKAAIEASLREASAPRPSAPVEVSVPDSASLYSQSNGNGLSQSYPPTVTPTPAVPTAPRIPSYDLEPLEADVIMTFSQTVEHVQAQGGDMSRYPAVNELYDKANALRPKMGMSLDDTGRKEQMLSEMHDKLSQAVKLYDKLLTDRINNPAWRSQPASAHPGAPAGAYGQPWSPVQQQQGVYAPPHSDSAGYASVYAPSYAPAPPQSYPSQPQYAPSPSASAPHEAIQPTQTGQSQAWNYSQQQYAQPQAPPMSPPPVQAPQPAPAPPVGPGGGYQSFAAAMSPPSAPTPAIGSPYTSSQPLSAPAPPPPASSLSRHHTVAAGSGSGHASFSPPSAPAQGAGLGRASTVSYGQPYGQPYQQQQQQQQQHQQQHQHIGAAPAPPSAPPGPAQQMPQFPAVPTGAPQGYYGPAVPQMAPQQERREEMLIEL
ncbi:ubiquitin binding protein [Coniophora puteana RWD-64-598 SS2]|uniref:Vacuolar protein sorting-associated protein 27 n=1 Tax=Coniophora puteana (strain RWD-64-598) TaxID=741705 RepID=A0A5M3N480_CONPW|nr:ubiquitin binding protein [Coniophora puteana RWD-64-598 SS2]EIW86229.1 ubiquitin binding protein [Coniophora puteana RWD-64-598 SS2]